MKKRLLTLLNLLAFITVFSQSGIGTHTPEGALDISYANNEWGLVLPQIDQAANTKNPTGKNVKKGTVVYDLKENCIKYFNGEKWSGCLLAPIADPIKLQCSSAIVNKDIIANSTVATQTTLSVPYSNTGEAFNYGEIVIQSKGVTGLKAVLSSGTIQKGSGYLVFTISGTPSAKGEATFSLSLAGIDCELVVPIASAADFIKLQCNSTIVNKDIIANSPVAAQTTLSVPYSNTGEAFGYNEIVMLSKGVTGLKAVLSSGTIQKGSGHLVFSISGTPSAKGEATFSLSIAGTDCELVVPIASTADFIKLQCNSTILNQDIIAGYAVAAQTTVSIPYSNTGVAFGYKEIVIQSKGVTGLKAVLSSGSIQKGSGRLVFSISGTPSTYGEAKFSLSIAGIDCEFIISVKNFTDVEVPMKSFACDEINQLGCTTLKGKHIIDGKEVTVDYSGSNLNCYSRFPHNCGGATITTTNMAFYLGKDSSPSTLVITFSHPVTNVGLAFTAGDVGEEYTFTINNNQPIKLGNIGVSNYCNPTIIDNKVKVINEGRAGNIIVGGKWFTELTIQHNGGGNGAMFGFCLNNSDAL